MSILDILRVTQLYPLDAVDVDVDVDEFVPLRFRTYREPLGVGYVRLGNYSTTLVEMAVEPRTQVVRGLTVTSICDMSPWPFFDIFEVMEGLPALATSFEGGEVLDLQRDFMVAIRPREIVVFWKSLDRCRGSKFRNICFLIAEDMLAGVWFTNLTEKETQLFESHAVPSNLSH
ncbi:MAG: hypothetical protein D6824_02690 [Planctomycetota bacterium]|nr:MAG: hypothetical protein D6824_02690 [Planctomycetota bacterium]